MGFKEAKVSWIASRTKMAIANCWMGSWKYDRDAPISVLLQTSLPLSWWILHTKMGRGFETKRGSIRRWRHTHTLSDPTSSQCLSSNLFQPAEPKNNEHLRWYQPELHQHICEWDPLIENVGIPSSKKEDSRSTSPHNKSPEIIVNTTQRDQRDQRDTIGIHNHKTSSLNSEGLPQSKQKVVPPAEI